MYGFKKYITNYVGPTMAQWHKNLRWVGPTLTFCHFHVGASSSWYMYMRWTKVDPTLGQRRIFNKLSSRKNVARVRWSNARPRNVFNIKHNHWLNVWST